MGIKEELVDEKFKIIKEEVVDILYEFDIKWGNIQFITRFDKTQFQYKNYNEWSNVIYYLEIKFIDGNILHQVCEFPFDFDIFKNGIKEKYYEEVINHNRQKILDEIFN